MLGLLVYYASGGALLYVFMKYLVDPFTSYANEFIPYSAVVMPVVYLAGFIVIAHGSQLLGGFFGLDKQK